MPYDAVECHMSTAFKPKERVMSCQKAIEHHQFFIIRCMRNLEKNAEMIKATQKRIERSQDRIKEFEEMFEKDLLIIRKAVNQ